MKLFYRGKDGGAESRVWGFWLIEWKRFFSIALLRFEDGSREAFHSHAFNAWSWVLCGTLVETIVDRWTDARRTIVYTPAAGPIFTPRDRFHKVVSSGRTWVLTFRGPWVDHWLDHDVASGVTSTLTHGRRRVA